MNKTLRLAIALALVQLAVGSHACWYPTFEPYEYMTCWIPEYEIDDEESMVDLWKRTMVPDVSRDEIKALIFSDGYTIEQLRELKVSTNLRGHLTANGHELLDYVCMMRQVNEQRKRMSNPWYYYYPGDTLSTALNKMADECMSRLDTRYGDRYAILAARAFNTLRRFDDLEELAQSHKFKDKDMEARFRPEYAGVLYRLGRYEEAAQIYAEAGYELSLKWCLKKLGLFKTELSILSFMSEYDSNYNYVSNELVEYIREIEKYKYSEGERDFGYLNYEFYKYYSYERNFELDNLIETAYVKGATPGKYQGLWRYAEAMGYLMESNNFAKVDSVLALVDTRKVEPGLGKSIRTLRFIAQSILKPYDSNYLSWVASEAEWLIKEGDKLMAKKERHIYLYPCGDDPKGNMESRMNHFSRVYYSDMLHKAADVIIVPRMLQHGDTVAALQMLDIVDYANFSDADVKEADIHGNASTCFALECGANVVIKAIGRHSKPKTKLDRLWVKTGSIRNRDRWLDFAGTTLLAEGRYKEAVNYLSMVSRKYASEQGLNYGVWMRDPFAVEFRSDPWCREDKVWIYTPNHHRLWFALQMSALEDAFNNEALSSETRAEARFKYGVGMANSVYPCWSLTRYGEGENIFFPWVNAADCNIPREVGDLAHRFYLSEYWDDKISPDPFALSHRRLNDLRMRGTEHMQMGMNGIKNPEKMAAYLRSMGHYRTIKHHYANTAVGREMQSKCDRWDMY